MTTFCGKPTRMCWQHENVKSEPKSGARGTSFFIWLLKKPSELSDGRDAR